ncbi:MAG: hypothetical protein QXJ02_06520 [Candidatus Bathyarchaeia archaeon]
MTSSFHRNKEWIIGTVSTGFFFILLGIMFVITPNLFNRILDFFRDYFTTEGKLHLVQVFPDLRFFVLPSPARPAAHLEVYSAVMLFSLVWGVFKILVLASRLALGSSLSKKADNASDIVFWLGTAYFVKTMLVDAQATTAIWFEFWAIVIMLLGASLLVRAALLATIPLKSR